jgi:protein lin-9
MSEDDSKAREDSMESSGEEEEDESFGPAALGLHRVGTELPQRKKTSPLQKLNARGRPARIRKKNTKYEDETEEGGGGGGPRSPVKGGSPIKKGIKTPVSTPVKDPKSAKKKTDDSDEEEEDEDESESGSGKSATLAQKILKKYPKKRVLKTTTPITESSNISNIDKKACQRIGLRLRNLLKLPKAHKFVMYEFFYSNIDRAIFLGTNDFETLLEDTFPRLKTRLLTRIEWNKVRRTFGKPRRCSAKFFEEERIELERKRQKIRLLQSRKTGDASFVCDLPCKIPIPFTIGTKVTARLRTPQDGLFTGTIDGLVHKSHSYRIVFERQGIGSQEIPDYEVMSSEYYDTLDINKVTKDFISRKDVSYYMVSPLKPAGAFSSFGNHGVHFHRGDPMLSSSISSPSFIKLEGYQRPKLPNLVLPTTGSIGGYPIKLLETMVLVRKTLEIKHLQLLKIRRMNVEAEVVKSFGDNAPEDFQKKYASLLVEMERINRDLADYLNILQAQIDGYVSDKDELEILTPTYLREKCRDLAMQTFAKNNNNSIEDDAMINLIGNLTTVMWVTSNLKNDQYSNVEDVLSGCLIETCKSLDPENRGLFEKNVQSHIHQIQIGIFDEMARNHGDPLQNEEIEILEEEEVVEEDVDDYVLGI